MFRATSNDIVTSTVISRWSTLSLNIEIYYHCSLAMSILNIVSIGINVFLDPDTRNIYFYVIIQSLYRNPKRLDYSVKTIEPLVNIVMLLTE